MTETHIEVSKLSMAYGDFIVMRDLNFEIGRGEIFMIMGGSGCGKSTLLRHMIGLIPPAAGEIRYDGMSLWASTEEERAVLLRRMGVLYQSGALWSSMTLAENIMLPLTTYTRLSAAECADLAAFKLELVGLGGLGAAYPSELSGGMRKRAALARAIALDPEILFFDEPSAGLDPVSARRLDDLILHLRDHLGSTVIIVTHELASIFDIGTDSIFLDAESKRIIGRGPPKALLEETTHEAVRSFLTRST